jgi:ankyrin repeat protein
VTSRRTTTLIAFVLFFGCRTAPLRPIDQQLLQAAARGHEGFDAALQGGANVNVRDANGWTPLMFAARNGDREAVAELLRRGADVNATNRFGQTALILCDAKTVQQLVDAGARFDAQTAFEPGIAGFAQTALMATSDVDKTRALLAAGAPVDATNRFGNTALWWAAFRGETERIRLLIGAGANVNLANGNVPPLLLAAENGDAAAVRLLVQAGADVRVRDFRGMTALHHAAKNLRRGVVEAVLATTPDINSRANDGCTPLMVATQEGYVENVRALLEAGADPTIRSGAGRTPLEWAVAKDNQELIALLRGAGAHEPSEPVPALSALKGERRTEGLQLFATDVTTDGRFAKIRGRVTNGYRERIDGIRYEVILMASDAARPLDTLRYEANTTIEPGQDAPMHLDVESMYFGSDTRILIRASPVKIGGREMTPPPGWTP